MAQLQAAWLTHQQQRFMRPDASRYMRHDTSRYLRPDAFRWSPPGTVNAGAPERKYSPDQPRVSAGSPEGGQWTANDGGEGGDSRGRGESVVEEILSELTDLAKDDLAKLFDLFLGVPDESELLSNPFSDDAELTLVANSGPKHHWVARQVFRNKEYSFSQETLNVFEKAVTAPLNDPTSNYFDTMHRQYNAAVKESLDAFMKRNSISSDQMTPDQARGFIDEIKRSSDPRIREFNRRLLMREINYWMRRTPRGET